MTGNWSTETEKSKWLGHLVKEFLPVSSSENLNNQQILLKEFLLMRIIDHPYDQLCKTKCSTYFDNTKLLPVNNSKNPND